MSKQLFDQALERYVEEVDLGEVQYDDVRGTSFVFETDIELFLLWNNQLSCVFASILCGCPVEEEKSKLFLQMLYGNHFWSKTSGATLCYDKQQNAIFLIDRWGVEVIGSDTKLAQNIAHLVNAGYNWKMQVEGGANTAAYSHHQMVKHYNHGGHDMEVL